MLDRLPLLYAAVEFLEYAMIADAPRPTDPSQYRHIPWTLGEFMTGLSHCHRLKHKGRWLSAGCGAGAKLLIADLAGFSVTGLEVYPPYVEAARHLLGNRATIIETDIRSWDGYRDFDVVYSYRPFVSDADQVQFEDRLVSHMRADSVLFLPMSDRPLRHGWQNIEPHIWTKEN